MAFFFSNSSICFSSPQKAFMVRTLSVLSCTYSDKSVKLFCANLKLLSILFLIRIIITIVANTGINDITVNFILHELLIIVIATAKLAIILVPVDINFDVVIVTFRKSLTK